MYKRYVGSWNLFFAGTDILLEYMYVVLNISKKKNSFNIVMVSHTHAYIQLIRAGESAK